MATPRTSEVPSRKWHPGAWWSQTALVLPLAFAALASPGQEDRPTLTRGPYLQSLGTDRVTVMWQTDIPTEGHLAYSLDSTQLGRAASLPGGSLSQLRRAHAVTIGGLTPGETYYYAVEDAAGALHATGSAYSFTTFPPAGTAAPLRVWALGDPGTGHATQRRVRDAYRAFAGANGAADLTLLLGDNAYHTGEESEYDARFFPPYRREMRRIPTFPASGNHDLAGAGNASTASGPFYELFAVPTAGELGGVASRTEAFYSFDYGDVHFVCLESTELALDPGAPMLRWLKADLDATRARWLIAFYHFPPYTKGTHDSDDPRDYGGRSIDVREAITPILEGAGVDLVLTGHSHAYERSFLLDGHYGYSAELRPEMVLDVGTGDPDGAGAYVKPAGLTPHAGAVYVVAGNAGQVGSLRATQPHPAMATRIVGRAGSLIVDVANDTLAVRFLGDDGRVRDRFAIVKPEALDPDAAAASHPGAVRPPYPNPARGLVHVPLGEATALLPDATLEVISAHGQLVARVANVGAGSATVQAIDLTGLSSGLYTLRLVHAGGVESYGTLVVE